MKFNKRGQSALEYLVTYGWAILAIVVVAAVLWYFGVFNPGQFASSSASARGFGDLNIKDQNYVGTNLLLSMGNAVGGQINVTGITLNGVAGTLASSMVLAAGEDGILNATVTTCGNQAAAYDVDVAITYNNLQTGVNGKTSAGKLKGTCG